MKKRLVSLLLVLALAFTLVPSAFADRNDCGSLVDMGESHGATVYDDWEYYNRTQHRRYAYCADCGEGEYEYDRHSTREQYEQYSAGQHRVTDYCDVCGHTVGYASYEDHHFAYGAWGAYNDAQHRRQTHSASCGYSSFHFFCTHRKMLFVRVEINEFVVNIHLHLLTYIAVHDKN